MKVKELIAALSAMPGELEVVAAPYDMSAGEKMVDGKTGITLPRAVIKVGPHRLDEEIVIFYNI